MKRALTTLLFAFLAIPVLAEHVPFTASVESIEFKDITQDQQIVLLDRIGVRVGDKLTAETRQRIGRELGKLQKGMTFTYKQGSRSGTAKVIISPDC